MDGPRFKVGDRVKVDRKLIHSWGHVMPTEPIQEIGTILNVIDFDALNPSGLYKGKYGYHCEFPNGQIYGFDEHELRKTR